MLLRTDIGPVLQDTNMQAHEMIATHPDVRGNTNDALIRCIEQCYSCAQVCTSCADACLAEDNIHNLTQCIRLDLCRHLQHHWQSCHAPHRL
jgi:hypothetical protein